MINRTDQAMKEKEGLRALMRRLAARPEGVGLREVPGYDAHKVGSNATKMKDLIVVGFKHERRLFIERHHAEAYQRELAAKKEEGKRMRIAKLHAYEKERNEKRKAERAAKRKETPPKTPWRESALPPVVTIKPPKVPFKDQPAIVPKHVKVQVIPSPEHFGPAARLAYAPIQEPWRLKPLRAGKEI